MKCVTPSFVVTLNRGGPGPPGPPGWESEARAEPGLQRVLLATALMVAPDALKSDVGPSLKSTSPLFWGSLKNLQPIFFRELPFTPPMPVGSNVNGVAVSANAGVTVIRP